MKHSHSYELHQILTYTSNLVNNKTTTDGEKQVMEHSYRGWKNCFYFNPGVAESRGSPLSYVSWRNEHTGSWFGTALCQALMKHSHSYELHQILTYTSNLVNNKTTTDGEKQVMEHSYRGWKNCFYFNPGVAESRGSPLSPN
ncbi:unnamed protein product [Oppiella nova]|uniref:Caspase family p10 domain-containing protein n=1 Tax=Oppiella nova TaxID=334625 RepID=A0A7R9QZP2_9ACAR|nr:unnamed protein product [Oppiella nova]CAG2180106.1 unnamed protein product [Oppiella nova]